MSETSTVPLPQKKRSSYRRLLGLMALVVIGSLAGWMIWGTVRDRMDAQTLQEYLAELEKREPDWQDRVYGKPLTAKQIEEQKKWGEVEQVIKGKRIEMLPFHFGMPPGMGQDADHPEAQLAVEQVEFLKAAHAFWQPVLQKLQAVGKLPPQQDVYDRHASFFNMINKPTQPYATTAAVQRNLIELEVIRFIAQNDPTQAALWYRLGTASPQQSTFSSMPFLVERWLNLTQPKANDLQQMQQALEQQIHEDDLSWMYYGSFLRMEEKLIHEIAKGQLSAASLDQYSYSLGIGQDSLWRASSLYWPRVYYVQMRMQMIFQRPHHLALRLHQLADRVEELSRLEPSKRWSTWKQFADTHLEPGPAESKGQQQSAMQRDVVPQAFEHLPFGSRFLRVRMQSFFEMHALHHTMLAAIIAERYRLDHGHFPKNWSELVPRYVEKPILDLFTGTPLLIKQTKWGIVIYSTGRDGKDHGGEILNHSQYWNNSNGLASYETSHITNLGTRVYHPELRRGKAIIVEESELIRLNENTKELLESLKKGEKQE